MKTIVLVRVAQLDTTTNRFDFYSSPEPFTTMKLAREFVTRAFTMNGGTNWLQDTDIQCSVNGIKEEVYQYDCLSTDGKPMQLKYILELKKLNPTW